jgi:predicted RNA binding protein YcfA (HicA-like mRNA interferase family)
MSIRKRIRAIRDLGWHVEKTPGGHLKLTRPDVPYPLFVPSTSSCPRGWRNMLSMMRRALRAEAARP